MGGGVYAGPWLDYTVYLYSSYRWEGGGYMLSDSDLARLYKLLDNYTPIIVLLYRGLSEIGWGECTL